LTCHRDLLFLQVKLGKLGLDDVLSKEDMQVLFERDSDSDTVIVCHGPVTVREFIDFVAKSYERLNDEEEQTGGEDRGGAVVLEGVELRDDGIWKLITGS
jgi:hypothetical protein